MLEFTADALRVKMQHGEQLRHRIIVKARTAGRTMELRMMATIIIENHFAEHGEPWNRQPWQFKGPTLAEMFSGRRMRTIPRELRRIHAPYP